MQKWEIVFTELNPEWIRKTFLGLKEDPKLTPLKVLHKYKMPYFEGGTR